MPRRWTASSTGASLRPLAAITTEFQTILVSREGSAARITLNRPEKRNALSLELMEEVLAALAALGSDRDVRTIVIEGAGPVFSSGHDLSEMIGREVAFYQRLFDVCTEMMEAIHRVPQPVIAKVHGVATAAGCQLVAACDLAVARPTQGSRRPASRSGSSARRRWFPSRARLDGSARSRCC